MAAESNIVAIAAGDDHSLALTEGGQVLTWGYGLTSVPAAAQSGIKAISAGHDYSMALTEGGKVLAWGYGQASVTSVPAAAQSGIEAISAGDAHSLALRPVGPPDVRPGEPPGPPRSVEVEAGDGAVLVKWTVPEPNGATGITYTVTASPGGMTCSTTADLCLVYPLSNGTSYTFTVVARNGAGAEAASDASDPITPATVPGAPLEVSAVAGNTNATVSWTAPASDGGAAITGYTVTSSPGSKTCSTPGANSCTITGLTNSKPYSFTVTARNRVGASTPSALSNTVVPNPVPGAPTTVTATAGDGEAVVSWTAPEPNGSTPVIGYTVTSNPSGKTCSTMGAPSCTVSGLTNGTGYTFTVTASNTTGPGTVSEPSTPIVPMSTPSAPTAVTAVADNAAATVSWTAPASDGGAPITGYAVTSSPQGRTCTTAGATTCRVGGLANGTAYTFTARAANAAGTGAASTASAAATPDVVPGAPTSVSAVAVSGAATVSWTAPASNGGSGITGYTVTATPGGRRCTSSGDTSCIVTGLANGWSYTFSVAAENNMGSGSASRPSHPVTPRTAPGAPTSVSAVPGNGTAVVSWTAPASDGGSAITRYQVTAFPGGRTCTTPGATSCSVSGLSNGTGYTFTVRASNSAGTGPASVASAPITPRTVPGAPTGVNAVAGNGSASLSWTAPSSNGGAAITGYKVTASPGGTTCTTTGARPCTVTGLSNGTGYTFTVRAINSTGTGPASAPSAAVTPRIPVQVTASKAGYGNVLAVNVDPNKSSGSYTFQVQRKTPSGWTTLTAKYATEGAGETRNVTLGAGTFRAYVPANGAYGSAVSPEVRLTAPTVKVAAGRDSARNKITVNVDPNKGSGYWTFKLQKRRTDGTWATLSTTYRTYGSGETRTINKAKGTYRAVVAGKYGYLAAASNAVTLAK